VLLTILCNMTSSKNRNNDYSRKWIYFGIASIAVLMATLDSSIVNVALPTLEKAFNADVKTVAWVSQSYILAMTALLLIGGKLMVVWGERKLFIIGFSLFTIGSGLCATSVSIYMLIFSRVFQALGGAILMSSNQALIAKSFPPHQRGRALGVIGTVVSIGLASGPPLGGFLIGSLGWRWIFYINLPIGVIAIIYCLRVLSGKVTVHEKYSFDWIGSILIVAGLGALFLGLTLAVDYGFLDIYVLTLFVFSVVILIAFLYNEKHVPNPLVNLSLFTNRYFNLSCASAFLAFVILMPSSILMPFYLQNVMFFSPQNLGLFMMTMPLAMLLVAPFAGWLSDVIGTRLPSSLGLAILGGGLFSLAFLSANSGSFDIIWRLAVIGLGMGLFGAPNSNAILSSVPSHNVGIASGMIATMRSSGITFGIAFSVILFSFFRGTYPDALLESENLDYYLESILKVFYVSAIVALIAITVSFVRGKRPIHKAHDEPA